MSSRVFELTKNELICIRGFNETYYPLDPKETTLILLSAKPYNGRFSKYFDPGHA